VNWSDALKLYGLGLQGSKGDVPGEIPSIINQFEYQKYKAWNTHRGKSRDDCEKEFLEIALPICDRLGRNTEDPNKDKKESEYKECLDKQINDAKDAE